MGTGSGDRRGEGTGRVQRGGVSRVRPEGRVRTDPAFRSEVPCADHRDSSQTRNGGSCERANQVGAATRPRPRDYASGCS